MPLLMMQQSNEMASFEPSCQSPHQLKATQNAGSFEALKHTTNNLIDERLPPLASNISPPQQPHLISLMAAVDEQATDDDHPHSPPHSTPTNCRRRRRSSLFALIASVFYATISHTESSWAQSVKNIHLGFPEAWDGDKHSELYCVSKNIPKFLDGYFLCQLSASYGDRNALPGQRLSHMIDAIGAVGVFHISRGEVTFTAKYYPARPYKIWEFYDRNMTKASVPWAGWSDYNLTAMSKWEQIPPNVDSARFHPNLDFWRVGTKVVAGTEAPYWVGYEFDVRSLDKFKIFPFTEENDIFGRPRPNLIPISMGIHERKDVNDIIWGTFNAMNFDEQRFYQGLFTVSPNGVRRVVAMYDYGAWDANACAKDDEYIGDKTLLPGYIHSITSTENYIILPITSLLINPCKFKEPPRPSHGSHIQSGGLWGMDFYDMVPMRFLVFDKRNLSWVTAKPMEVFPSMFVTHQLNAFENANGEIIADMIVYDSNDPYVKYFYTDFLTSQVYPSTARILRFTLDIEVFRVMYSYLIPQETIAADFPQINHEYDAKPYQWAYIVEHPFAGGNQILKINVEDPAGAKNLRFRSTDAQMVLQEPWFVQRPDATAEDDGVLLIRALNLEENRGVLLIVDPLSMTEIARAVVPISVPFGFHNRFFSKRDLGIRSDESDYSREQQQIFGATQTSSIHNKWERPWSKKSPPDALFKGHIWNRIYGGASTALPSPQPFSWQPLYPVVTDSPPPPPIEATDRATPLPWWPTPPSASNSNNNFIYPENPESSQQPAPAMHRLVPVTPTTTLRFLLLTSSTAAAASSRLLGGTRKQQPSENNFVVEVTATPLFPASGGAQPHVVVVDEQLETSAASSLTLRMLYERTLRALCRWLPRVFNQVTYQGCMVGGQKALRWMAPLSTNRPGVSSHEPSEDPSLFPGTGSAVSNGRQTWLRPILRPPDPATASPWYNYRTQVILANDNNSSRRKMLLPPSA